VASGAGEAEMITWTGIIILPVVVILWVISYLLIVKNRTGLIAGYDREKVSDPGRYSSWIGFSVFLCGLGLLITWSLIASEMMPVEFMLPGIIVSAAICIVLAFTASAKFRK
jgi:hypothetical protein